MKKAKIYTRTGDRGNTKLGDGSKMRKCDIRVNSYGTVDELNSFVALIRLNLNLSEEDNGKIDPWLEAIQNDLFNLGTDLSTPMPKRWPGIILIGQEEVKVLEQMIDSCEADLPKLGQFVLPGGSLLNAYCHCARTICRRAERLAVELQDQQEINPQIVPYLNRLSDLFFSLSRWVLARMGLNDVTWDKNKGVKQWLGTNSG